MPFGLANTPATFQSYIHKALSDLLDTCCIVYLDNILIYSCTEAEHIQYVQMVLGQLWKYQLFCKASKCKFHTDTVNFLGFIIHLQGVEMEQEWVETILDWPVPKSAHDILMFLRFANFYHQFIHKYSTIAAPLNDMTKGTAACAGCQKFKKGEFYNNPNFNITECALHAFEELKLKFSDAPLLIYFDPNHRISIDSDASDFVIARVYTQLHDDGQ